ncbi:MAG: ATP-dependent DNA helicase RecG [Rhodospirillaceae bacterium]|nr:ATP-dependent DNA helicase RecG [Rhodospirillaceae bacterium]
MRPSILFPLFAPVTRLDGIGPKLGQLMARVAGEKVVDLLWHLPSGLIDRRHAPKVGEARPGEIATLTVKIHSHEPSPTRKRPYRIVCGDDTGFLTLVFFNAKGDYLLRQFPVGETRIVSGMVDEFGGGRQMAHPDYVGTLEQKDELATVEPVYPLTEGLTPRVMRKAVAAAVKLAPELPEWADPHLVRQRGWPGWHAALGAAHAPQSPDDLRPETPARLRLAYDELLAGQIALRLVRSQQRRLRGRAFTVAGNLRRKALAALPFTLTGAQQRALGEIDADMGAEARMMRLLQGDVGSGKTVVAFLAMLNAVESGAQAALMAPTEILARQHHATVAPLAEAIGVRAALLTGRDSGAAREALLARLAAGEIDILIGTHALISEDVDYRDLAFAVIDEQHRFGVHQRLSLSAKGERADLLVMTATPIPRTLLLAHYGDLDASRLDEKPANRKPIATRVLPLDRLDEVYPAIRRALGEGARVYWVCPLVEESEIVDLAAATERHRDLEKRFPGQVGLVHGKLPGRERDKVMRRFASGELAILVATTVIEVGVDVPDATVMLIEHAERFGLAQLHQLRGRVGRGDRASTCLLLYQGPLGETAKARLAILRETEDGFRIAEEDLRLRGGGDALGARQSGLPAFRLADLATQAELLPIASDDAKLILDKDPQLTGERGQAVRTLLYLFERDEGVRLLRTG